uniref:AlNc14C15G1723 protein n=1 Tax=Albugo laibachii Nc14 TaxID=890382 RepID=F0W440_9STRA|nr:AlNc14C15G1723 [Albugo laibachii Nc14]|eukprot:CCA15837.1 AlNc14C15G1723 [Albugo laibachii Nc14]
MNELQRRKEQSDLRLEDLSVKWTDQHTNCIQTSKRQMLTLHNVLQRQRNKFACHKCFQNWRIVRYKVIAAQLTHELMLVFDLNQRQRTIECSSSIKQDEMWKRWRSINPAGMPQRQDENHSRTIDVD